MIRELKNINSNQEKPTNYLPYILGGIGLIALVIGIIWLVNRNNKER